MPQPNKASKEEEESRRGAFRVVSLVWFGPEEAGSSEPSADRQQRGGHWSSQLASVPAQPPSRITSGGHSISSASLGFLVCQTILIAPSYTVISII